MRNSPVTSLSSAQRPVSSSRSSQRASCAGSAAFPSDDRLVTTSLNVGAIPPPERGRSASEASRVGVNVPPEETPPDRLSLRSGGRPPLSGEVLPRVSLSSCTYDGRPRSVAGYRFTSNNACGLRGGGIGLRRRPHQRDGLGEVADIIDATTRTGRVGPLRDQGADHAGLGMLEPRAPPSAPRARNRAPDRSCCAK